MNQNEKNLERLVLIYDISDGCTYSFQTIEPIIYKSKKDAVLDFGSLLLSLLEKKNKYQKDYDLWETQFRKIKESDLENFRKHLNEKPKEEDFESFSFGGQEFELRYFLSEDCDLLEPEILTIDEWFSFLEN